MFKDNLVVSGQLFDGRGQPSCLFVIRRVSSGTYKAWISSTLCPQGVVDEADNFETEKQAMEWVLDRADY